jgi:hypothetical protein
MEYHDEAAHLDIRYVEVAVMMLMMIVSVSVRRLTIVEHLKCRYGHGHDDHALVMRPTQVHVQALIWSR